MLTHETGWELPADLERFLIDHPEAQVVVGQGEVRDRLPAGQFHPRLGAFAEGPTILTGDDSVRLPAMRLLSLAKTARTACVRLERPFLRFTHLSLYNLMEREALIYLFTRGVGIRPEAGPEAAAAPTAFRLVTDLQSRILEADADFASAVGVAPEKLTAQTLLELARVSRQSANLPPSVGYLVDLSMDQLVADWVDGITAGLATARIHLGGRDESDGRWYQMTQHRDGGRVEVTLVDVTADVVTAIQLEHSARELEAMAETVPIGIFRSTTAGEILFKNSKLTEVFGVNIDGGFPIHLVKTLSGDSALDVLADMLISTADTESEATLDVTFEPPDKAKRYLRLRVRGYQNSLGRSEVTGSVEDVSHEYEQRRLLQLEVSTDPLSGTANRRGLEAILEQRLGVIGTHQPFAVLLCDLDGFKQVNDSLGHEAGDAVIAEVGSRLMDACRTRDAVGRLGGDEFVVVAEGIDSYSDGLEFAERVMNSLRPAFMYHGAQIVLSASIGVAISEQGSSVLGLLQMADHAMYKAKRSGRNQAQPYQLPDSTTALSPLALRRDLRRAIRENTLTLAYQPIVNLTTGMADAAEALLRWSHPTQGLVSPEVVIPVAEQSGLIRRLGGWSIDQAVKDAATVNEGIGSDQEPIRIAINVSAIQLNQPDLVGEIESAISRWDTHPQCIGIELTESHLLENEESAIATLAALADMGITISVDDFGSAYSSFKYLLTLPAHVLKLDPSITQGLHTKRFRSVVTGMAHMAADLGLDLVIEGIEEQWQMEAAREAGVTHAQGYYLARPMPVEDLQTLTGEKLQ